MKNKILLMFPSKADKGGVSIFCQVLMENLSSSFEAEYFQIANRPGNKNPIRRILFFLQDIFRLRKTLKKNKYDAIHLNPSFKVLSLLRDSFFLVYIYKFYCKNILVMFHGWDTDLAERVKNKAYYKKLFKYIYLKAGVILVLCSQFKQQLIDIGISSQKIKIITAMFEKNSSASRSKDKTVLQKTVILFMSRLVKRKGAYIAAETGKLLMENGYKDFSMIIAGDGPELEGIQRYIEKNRLGEYITAPGYVSGEQKRDIFSKSDIFLFPTSYGEGCPAVVVEAMGAGLAVISTPVAAIPDIVTNNENGFIIDSKTPEPFYWAVKKLIENRGILERMQKRNRAKAEKNYEVKVVTKEIELGYKEIIND